MCAKILISPLDWGLGHATRMIPVISWLTSRNHEVFLASCGESGNYLRKEFPHHDHFHLPGFEVRYSSGRNFCLNMALQLPALKMQLNQERLESHKLAAYLKPDIIISDNRYGLNQPSTFSVLVTHQTNIIVPFLIKPVVSALTRNLINRFDECWIPDTPSGDFSGKLSETKGISSQIRHIGLLSTISSSSVTNRKFDVCLMVSGPEPQRSLLLNKLCKLASQSPDHSFALVTPVKPSSELSSNITFFENAERRVVNEVLLGSKLLIGRSGYSTIMDIAGTGLKAVFIPTPGQSEQEWLARYFSEKGIALYKSQEEEISSADLTDAMNRNGFTHQVDKNVFIKELERLGF